MNIKVSLCYFSTLFSKGYKSEQIKAIINEFESNNIDYYCYTLDYSLKYTFLKKVGKFYISSLPFYISKIYNKFNLQRIYPSYFNYLYSEKLYSLIFGTFIVNDDSRVVILKNRPHSLVKKIRNETNKIIIIESDQQHPNFTCNLVGKELEKYKIRLNNIYTNKNAIKDYYASFEYADLIIVYTKRQKEILMQNGVKSKILINELGLESSPNFKPKSTNEISNIKFKFISFANHTILKGTHKLIELWSELTNNFELIVAGTIEPDFQLFLDNYQKKLTNITFIENFNKHKLRELSCEFNLIGISLSLSEAYPRVVSEFFELGIPVIVSRIIDRDVDKYNFGEVVDYDDSKALMNALQKLINPENYFECQQNIYNHKFKTYRDFAIEYLNIIKNQISE